MVKAGYKQTEIGEIPEDWEAKEIRQVCKLINGRGFKPHEWKRSGLPIIRIQNLNGSDEFNYYDGLYDRKLEVNEGQLLFAWSGSRGTSFGPHVWKGDRGLLNYHTWKVVTDNNAISGEYFLYALRNLTASIEEKAHGASALVHTQKWEMEGYKFPAPKEPAEQKAIADALSDVDTLITSLERLIEKKRDIKTATMQQLLTGKKRLPGFGDGKGTKHTELGEIPEDWEVVPLGDLLRIRHGKSQKDVESPQGEYPILATGGEIGRAKQPIYSKPSVLIGRKGTIDVPYYMDTPFWTVDTLFYSEISDRADAKFLFYKFHFIDWYKYNEASGVPSLSSATIEKIPQAVPKECSEQQSISSFISDFDNEISLLEEKLRKTKAIKQGMMQELLTGRTRLV